MIQISAVIITLNEEKNIRRCLESIAGIVDEIIVIDSFSTDKTEEIAREFNLRFIKQEFLGYGEQKNSGNSYASFDYILCMDADEALSEELKKSIISVKKDWSKDVYEFNRLNNYCGKWIKHGAWYPDRKQRLFDRRKAQWQCRMVHERLELNPDATVDYIKGDLLHFSYYSITEHVQQINKYSELSAKEMLRTGKSAGLFRIIFSAKFNFFKNYIIKAGFKDGFYGLVIAMISSFETFLKYAKLLHLRKQ